jgi:hypothetical protein
MGTYLDNPPAAIGYHVLQPHNTVGTMAIIYCTVFQLTKGITSRGPRDIIVVQN